MWQQWFDRGKTFFDSPPQPRPPHQLPNPSPNQSRHQSANWSVRHTPTQPSLSIHGDGPDEDAQSQGPHSSHHSVTTPHEEVGVGGHEDEQSSGLKLGAMDHGDGQSPRQPPKQSPKPHSRKGQRQDTGPWTSSPAGSPTRSITSESLSRIRSM